jgi:hypothetical protein
MLRPRAHLVDLSDQVSQILAACDEINFRSVDDQERRFLVPEEKLVEGLGHF